MTTLADICEKKREHVARCKSEMPESRLREKIKYVRAPRGFKAALEKKCDDGQIALIAEIKQKDL